MYKLKSNRNNKNTEMTGLLSLKRTLVGTTVIDVYIQFLFK